MVRKITEVQRPLAALDPAFRPRTYRLARRFIRLYLRLLVRVRRVSGRNVQALAGMYRRFQQGKVRFIIAFRHPLEDDGTVQFYLWSRLVPAAAREAGWRLRDFGHAHFIYSRDVPLWAGAHVGRFFAGLGAVPLLFGKMDSEGLRLLRRYLLDGRFPVAMAPEAQVSYHCRRLPALAPGAAQMAFWCEEDLRRAGRSEEVYIVPVGSCYHFLDPRGRTLDRLLQQTEAEAGLSTWGDAEHEAADGGQALTRLRRLRRIEAHLLEQMEAFYGRFYGARFEPGAEVQARIEAVAEAALGAAESFFGLPGRGDFVQRVLALRRAGLERMYREDIPDIAALPPLTRALADRVAAESFLRLRHMELVDAIAYWRADYVGESSDFDRLCEYATNLYDYVGRLRGGNISTRSNLFLKDAVVSVGEPIPVSGRWQEYQADRKRAVQGLTDQIADAFRALIRSGCP